MSKLDFPNSIHHSPIPKGRSKGPAPDYRALLKTLCEAHNTEALRIRGLLSQLNKNDYITSHELNTVPLRTALSRAMGRVKWEVGSIDRVERIAYKYAAPINLEELRSAQDSLIKSIEQASQSLYKLNRLCEHPLLIKAIKTSEGVIYRPAGFSGTMGNSPFHWQATFQDFKEANPSYRGVPLRYT